MCEPIGCVVAGRLAYADPNLKVMLIEGAAIVTSSRLDLIDGIIQAVRTTGTIPGYVSLTPALIF
jgi:hypothetical protein